MQYCKIFRWPPGLPFWHDLAGAYGEQIIPRF